MKRTTLSTLIGVLILLTLSTGLVAQKNQIPDNIFATKTSPLAQNDEHQGFYAAFGYFAGYSLHAASYMSVDQGVPSTYTGFRAFTFDARGGWGLNDQLVVYGTAKLSPGNSTLSYYHYLYSGGALAYYPDKHTEFAVHAGAGYYNAKVRRGQLAGKGLLFNLGAGLEFSNHVSLEGMFLFGKLQGDPEYPYPFRTHELNASLGVFWILY
ncbi:MAG: hypothetical protein H6561_13180 [Lewinellaceae bacterium]|nr:hypothetical protein [Lewinellaceae bacterium]